ncbi:hypothetical protein [Micromonospora sp. U21]|uniref:hypothetical protein n=1 Tax=Micromonospora sp. U21 TaxID=2824899 RepID=UPI001FFD88A4|nr:hypothetical protein [Micromonospora sp. U21]
MNAVQTYRHLQPSALRAAGLDLQTCGGPTPNPRFFSGFLTTPAAAAAGLLAVADPVARGGASRLVTEARRLATALAA